MATVFELSEPYRNHLIPVLPPGSGVCADCWTAIDPDFRVCYPCNAARVEYGSKHPLASIEGTIVGQTRSRFQPLLTLSPSDAQTPHTLVHGRYRARRLLRNDPAVLLIDDTWTMGGNAQAAAIALHDAGAATVATVVIGRHFDRSFGHSEDYYQLARRRRFSWDTCCLELGEEDYE